MRTGMRTSISRHSRSSRIRIACKYMLTKIKKIREATGAGMMEIKRALEEAGGDEGKAREILQKRGQEKAQNLTAQSAKE